MIDDELRVLAAMLAKHVPEDVVNELFVYVEAGEPEVGLEQLCETLSDEEEPLTRMKQP